MDKYQQTILNKCSFSINNDASIELDADTLIIKQCENAYITKFELVISSTAVEVISVNNKNIELKNDEITISIDFDKTIKKLILISKGGITEPITLKLKYIASDKEEYDQKTEKNRIENCKKISNAKIIENIFGAPCVIFNPCCDDYAYTEVEFIATNDQGTSKKVFPRQVPIGGHSYSKEINSLNIILQRKRNEKGCNYIQFTNIGECGLKAHIYQYDKNDKLLIDYEIV